MPCNSSKHVVPVDASLYCSAPPLTTSRVTPPHRPMRAEEARRLRKPLRTNKTEAEEVIETAEFAFNDEEEKVDVEPRIEPDPRHVITRVAAVSVRHPGPAAAASSGETRHPSNRAQSPIRPGPANPARRPGRLKAPSLGRRLIPSWTCRCRPSGNRPRPQRPGPAEVCRRRRAGHRGALCQPPSGVHEGGGPFANPPRSTTCPQRRP